ncbi:MAG: hypothetical protein R3C15_13725 [Thermoleophilia bacterium]
MRVRLVLPLAVVLALAVAAGAAAAPPSGAVAGRYTFTFTTTNVETEPSVLVLRVLDACAAPCASFETLERLADEQAYRGTTPRVWRWRRDVFVFRQVSKGASDCVVGTRTVRRGYDVVSTYRIRPGAPRKGRIRSFEGTGLDDYRVNARGRKAGCTTGGYDFAITATAG